MRAHAIQFTEEEKQALTLRLQSAATQTSSRTPRRWLKRAALLGAAAALTVAAAAVGMARPLFNTVGASLTIERQEVPCEARMTLNEDGSATITVTGGKYDQATIITVPPVTAKAMLAGETDGGFSVARTNGTPYELIEESGRLWLFVNERIPLDVTDLLAEGYTFTYTDEDGTSRNATVSGTVSAYQVTH